MTPDCELLGRYAEDRSEEAFADLVGRHIDLVYSAALRQVNGDACLAQDIAQIVFSDLARKAAQLSSRKDLAGWLYTSAHFAATKAVRTESRRRTREQEARTMHDLLQAPNPEPGWESLKPVLDQAMHDLEEADREAVLLRYFQNNAHTAIADKLGINEDAARMRVERALEKLRKHLLRRGIATTTAAFSIVVSANAVQAAPVGLAVTISTVAALAGTTVAANATATTIKTIAMTTLQKTLVTATLAVAVGAGIYEARQASQLREQNQSLQQQQAPLTDQLQQLRRERDDATNRLAWLADEIRRLNQNSAELIKLRGEVTGLRLAAKDLAQLKESQARPAGDPAGKNIINYAATQAKQAATNSVARKLERMSAKLGLTAEQQQSAREILLGNVEARTEANMAAYSGDFPPEEIKLQMDKITRQEDEGLGAVLTPGQMAAYEQMRTDEFNEGLKSFATREMSGMKGRLNLSAEQAAQMVSALSGLKPGAGGAGITDYSNAKEQLEIRLRALEAVLTPKQLEDYRKMKLANIEQTALERRMEQQAFKSLSK